VFAALATAMREILAGNKDIVTASSEDRAADQTDDARKYASNDRMSDTDGERRPLYTMAPLLLILLRHKAMTSSMDAATLH